jgi:hypothetical protein
MIDSVVELDSRGADRIIVRSRDLLADYRLDMRETDDPLEVAGRAVSVFGNLWIVAQTYPQKRKAVLGLIEQYRDLVAHV